MRAAPNCFRSLFPYLVLLQVGFTMPPLLPAARCALTAPFHPYRRSYERLGGLLSVALSVGSRPPGVTWHLALRSPDFPRHVRDVPRLSGQLGRNDSTLLGSALMFG